MLMSECARVPTTTTPGGSLTARMPLLIFDAYLAEDAFSVVRLA
jgi:hypothetical protein